MTQASTAQGRRTILADTQALSRGGREALDAALTPLGEGARAAYWASVRKCYNAPYEEDGHRRRPILPPAPTAYLPPAAACAAALAPDGLTAAEQAAPL